MAWRPGLSSSVIPDLATPAIGIPSGETPKRYTSSCPYTPTPGINATRPPIGSSARVAVGRSSNSRELDGQELPGGLVHFGYKDNIAQPHFDGIRNPTDRPDMQPLVEVGAVLLGYKTPVEDLRWEVPEPREDLGFNGSFNAFRVLEQQVDEFERFLSAAADAILDNPLADQLLPPKVEKRWDPPLCRRDAMRELVAAKILGRWRNGVPLVLSPTSPTPDPPIGTDRLNKI